MCIKRNNNVFIVGSVTDRLWRHRMHNMETRVESPWFFREYGSGVRGYGFVAVSPRSVLDGGEDAEVRMEKMRAAIRRCSTVYVPLYWASDEESEALVRYARRRFKRVIVEEDE